MTTTEEQFFYKLVMLIAVLYIAGLVLYASYTFTEYFSSNEQPAIGDAKITHAIRVHPVAFSPAVPFREHTRHWIVGVPLVPFKAPLIRLPIETPIPSFLIYNPQYLVPVQNQGDCGSCFCFAVADMLGDRAMIMSAGQFQFNLSVQQIMACFDRDACKGGSPEEVCEWMQASNMHVSTDRIMPYRQQSGGYVSSQCRKQLSPPTIGIQPGSIVSLAEFIPERNYDPSILERNIDNMKQELIQNGPFYCAMSVYDDLYRFSGTSVYEHDPTSTLIGGHAVELIGYSEQGADPRPGFTEPYWIARNSWSRGWPLHSQTPGYFCIRMGKNESGIESRCGAAVPVIRGAFRADTQQLALDDIRLHSFDAYKASL